MAGKHSKSGDLLHSNLNLEALNQQLVALDNGLYKLVCVNQFYHSAIQAITQQDEPDFNTEWGYGLHALGEWINDSAKQLIQQLQRTRQSINEL